MPHQHQHFLTAQDFPYPPGSIPVASPRRRLIATPSRRRRIIYETARSTANLYVQHGIDKHIQEKGASTTIQSFIRRHVAERRFQTLLQRRNDASTIIQYRFRSQQAKQLAYLRIKRNQLQKEIQAATIITSFFRKTNSFHLVQSLRLEKAHTAEINRMATRAQRFLRGALARRKVEEMHMIQLHMECAAIVIQSFLRTVLAKHTYIFSRYREQVEPSVHLIQRAVRGHLAISHRRKLLYSTMRLQGWWRKIVLRSKPTVVVEVEKCPLSNSINSFDFSETCLEEKTYSKATETHPDLHLIDTSCESSSESEASVNSLNHVSSSGFDDTFGETKSDDESINLEPLHTHNVIIIQRAIRHYFHKNRLFQAHQLVNNFVDHAIDRIANHRWEQLLASAAIKIQALVRGYLGRTIVSKNKSKLFEITRILRLECDLLEPGSLSTFLRLFYRPSP